MENIEQQNNESASSFNIKDFLWICLSKWYLFVIVMVFTFGYSFYYLAKTQRHYVASASLLFKDDTSGKNGDITQILGDIEGFNTSVNLSNEMVSIKSPVIMREVVSRLGLDVDYEVKDGIRHRVIFGTDQPVTVKFLDLGEDGTASFKAHLPGDGTAILTEFVRGSGDNGERLTETMTVNIKENNDTLASPLGRLIIKPNPEFEGDPETATTDIFINRVGTSAATGRGIGGLSTSFVSQYSSVIDFNYNDVNPQRAKATLQCVIDVYGENWIADRNQISIATSNFINERLAVIENELGDVDTDISSYKSQHQLPDVQAASQVYFNRAIEASDAAMQYSNQLTLARQVRDHLSNIANSYSVLPATTGLNNIGIEGQISAYNARLIERNHLVANSSTENPVIVDIDNQLNAMRQTILSSIDSYITSLNANIRATQASQASSSAKLAANPSQAKYLLSVERQQKVKESLYLYLLQKREENELSQAFTAYNSRVVNPPHASGPVFPVPQRTYMIAFALGLLIPAALIFLLEMLNSTVRGRRDIEKLTIPFVGEIPFTGKRQSRLLTIFKRKPKSGVSKIVVEKGRGNIINEAFRVIRTNLEFMVPTDLSDARTIMLTSANPGSGKTFISLNLGSVLALKDKKVAILDLDLRKASLSAVVGSPAVGLSNYLTGAVAPKDIVIKAIDGHEGLDMYPVGPIPPNPAELLYSDRLVKLIEDLKHEYDYIIIDCPPVEVVADAKIINRLVDLTIFVIRAGVLDRAMLPEIQRFYTEKHYRAMAVILNGTPDTSGSAFHRANRFGYGYGYGYGYPRKK